MNNVNEKIKSECLDGMDFERILEHPNQNWNNNYLIYLYADLDKWRVRLDLTNKDYSIFREPDLNNQLTAIALQDDGRMFKKLKLVGNY